MKVLNCRYLQTQAQDNLKELLWLPRAMMLIAE